MIKTLLCYNHKYLSLIINITLKGQDIMTNKTYIKNTALLFSAMAITKIVGAIFKIPLANIIGGTGMGYFSTAYNLYSPVFALTAAGVPTVIMRLTAKNIALGRCNNALRAKRTAMLLFSVIGFAGMLGIWLFAAFFANNIACSPDSFASVITIAPAILFCCIGAVIRGYYEGKSNVVPSVTANITETVTRAVIGLALSYGVVSYAKLCYENGNEFFGYAYSSYEDAYAAALPWAAAAAILAVTLSELAGLIALLFSDRRKRKSIPVDSIPTDRRRNIAKTILKELFPIAAFALVMNCFSFVDLLTVTRTLDNTIKNTSDFFTRAYPLVFADGITIDSLANFMYGSYTGIAMSLFMLIPSFASMTEKTSVPGIAGAWEKGDETTLQQKTSELIRAAALIGYPACFGALALAEPILTMLYPDRPGELSVCINAFVVLCVGGVFMITASSFFGIFQAIGKGHIPLWIMTSVIAIKALLNIILMSIPELNITGAAISTIVSYTLAAIISGIILKRTIKKVRISASLAVPAICATMCAVAAFFVQKAIAESPGSIMSVGVAVLAGVLVYVISLILIMHFRKLL